MPPPAGEGLVKLEEGAVAGVRVHEKHRVRKVLAQPIRVRDRDHFVVNAIDDECGLMDALEIGEPGPARLLPLTERRHLRGDDIRSRWRVEILCRWTSLSINAPPAAWLDGVGAKKIFCNTAYPLRAGLPRCLARLGFSRCMMSSPPRGAVPTRIIRWMLEGRSSAICCATIPPSENPSTSQLASTTHR